MNQNDVVENEEFNNENTISTDSNEVKAEETVDNSQGLCYNIMRWLMCCNFLGLIVRCAQSVPERKTRQPAKTDARPRAACTIYSKECIRL